MSEDFAPSYTIFSYTQPLTREEVDAAEKFFMHGPGVDNPKRNSILRLIQAAQIYVQGCDSCFGRGFYAPATTVCDVPLEEGECQFERCDSCQTGFTDEEVANSIVGIGGHWVRGRDCPGEHFVVKEADIPLFPQHQRLGQFRVWSPDVVISDGSPYA